MSPAAIGQPVTPQTDVPLPNRHRYQGRRGCAERLQRASRPPEHPARARSAMVDAVCRVRRRLYYQRQSQWELRPRSRGQVDSPLALDSRGSAPFGNGNCSLEITGGRSCMRRLMDREASDEASWSNPMVRADVVSAPFSSTKNPVSPGAQKGAA